MDMLVTCLFLLEIFVVMLCAVSLSTGLTCDLTKQNPVRNDTLMAIVGCLNCRECLPGYEPIVPCGKIIGIHERVGGCRPCPDGTYSPNRDAKACKICRKKKCFKHQRIEGKCERDKHDLSHCLNECEKGYKINKRKTACRRMGLTTIATIGSNIPKVTPTMTSRNTTKKLVVSPNQANQKSNGLNSDVILVVIGTIVAVGIAIAALHFYCRRKQKRANLEDGNGSDKMDVWVDGPVKETAINGPSSPDLPIVERPNERTDELFSSGSPCPETMAEHGNSKLPSLDNATTPETSHSISCISNDGIAPPTRNDQLAFNTPEHSPLPAGCGREQFLPTIIPNPYLYSSDVLKNSNESRSKRLDGDIPYKIICMICDHFDYEDNWERLATWLKLRAQEVKRIKNKSLKSKTEQIIQIWATREENDLEKFLQILSINGITQLVAEINEEMAASRQEYIC